MIFYLHSDDPVLRALLARFLKTHGRPLAGRFRPIRYSEAFAAKAVRRGTWIFSDLERLPPRDAERAARLWSALDRAGQRVLNHPTRSLRRFELLRRLHEGGVNAFDVWRLNEARTPTRFPVFLRMESDHRGSLGDLVRTPDEFRMAVRDLDKAGRSRDDAIAVEFCDTSDAEGVFAKYGAFFVDGRVIPRHLFFAKQWEVKEPEILDAERLRREHEYLESNPHAEQIRDVFARARLDWGRIDYAMLDDRIQVWEINTHPILPSAPGPGGAARVEVNARFAKRFLGALDGVDARVSGPRVRTGFGRRSRLRLEERLWSAAWRAARALRRDGDTE